RDLARLAALHGRHEFEQSHWEAGVEDATAILALSRHVGLDPSFLCIIVRYRLETFALDLLAPYLLELQALWPRILAAYDALPPGATYQQAFVAEKKYFIEWLVRRLREAETQQKGAWRDVMKRAFVAPEVEEVVQKLGTYERALQQTEAVLPVS